MKLFIITLLTCGLFLPATSQTTALNNRFDSVSYGMGVLLGRSISQAGITEFNKDIFLQGVKDITGKSALIVTIEEANDLLNMYLTDLQMQKAAANLIAAKNFLGENAKKEGVVTLPSGLQYKVIREGEGNSPMDTSVVTVHYTGTFINGEVFDSSVERGEPATFGVDQVIPGWTEALQLMKKGSNWIIYLPPDLGYGENSPQGIEPNSLLIFDVQLLSFE